MDTPDIHLQPKAPASNSDTFLRSKPRFALLTFNITYEYLTCDSHVAFSWVEGILKHFPPHIRGLNIQVIRSGFPDAYWALQAGVEWGAPFRPGRALSAAYFLIPTAHLAPKPQSVRPGSGMCLRPHSMFLLVLGKISATPQLRKA